LGLEGFSGLTRDRLRGLTTPKGRHAMGDTGKKDKDKHRKQQSDKQAQEAKRRQEQKQKKVL
jgi:hypothetical protein